jgi:chromosomal replication initiator protein
MNEPTRVAVVSEACTVNDVVLLPLPGEPCRAGLSFASQSVRRTGLCEFVVGPENGLIRSAVDAFLDDPRTPFNPLVFHGPQATGKTHLVRSIADVWRLRRPKSTVIVTSGAELAKDYALATETREVSPFGQRLASADLLVVDDVRKVARNSGAQEALIGALDQLLERGSKVAAADRYPPRAWNDVSPRLASRLSGGLPLRLSPLGTDAERTLVRRLAEVRGVSLSPRAEEQYVQGRRPMTRAVDRAVAFTAWCAGKGIRHVDEAVMAGYLDTIEAPLRPTINSITAQTARYFRLRVADLRGKSRQRALYQARSMAMYLARELTPLSMQRIASFFGGRDHPIVVLACRQVESMLNDPQTREALETITEWLGDPPTKV